MVQELVRSMRVQGLSAEEMVKVLSEQNERLQARVFELESIAPRRIPVPGGYVIERCPDHLIPVACLEYLSS